MKLRVVLCLYGGLICLVGGFTQVTSLPNHLRNIRDTSHQDHGGQHKGHGHAELRKKDELEVELLKLKYPANEDKADISTGPSFLRDTSRGGQPEFTNEDLEEELTEVRPLDMPLHLLQLDIIEDFEQQRFPTSTMRTFGLRDKEVFTTSSSRMNTELQLRQELEDDTWDQEDESKTEEAEHSGDGSNLSPPESTTTAQYGEQKNEIDKKDDENYDSDDEDDDGDDDNDGTYDDDDDGDDDEDDEEGDDNDDDDASENDDNDDDDGDDQNSITGNQTENLDKIAEDKRTIIAYKKKSEIKNSNTSSLNLTADKLTYQISQKTDFEDSVEHGRQWRKQVESSEEIKEPSTSDKTEWSPLTTTPQMTREALERDLAAFLRNGSPESEDTESRNVSKRPDDRNTKKHSVSEEAEFDTLQKLEQIRQLEKKADIPQKLVDSVSPKADEDLLELMVRIAENPSEWQQVHHVLQQLDQDLITSRKSVEAKLNEKKTEEEGAVNKVKVTKEHRKHQQEEKKKKKKKKQRQKEKLKAKEEKETMKLKVKGKGKGEIRRKQLEKAGVLTPTNSLFKGSEKEETLQASKEISKGKSYKGKDSLHSKIKGNSLESLADAVVRKDEDKNEFVASERDLKEDWPIIAAQKGTNGRMSNIDSAIAYLSEPKQSLYDNQLPSPTKSNKSFAKSFPPGTVIDEDTDTKTHNPWVDPPNDWHKNWLSVSLDHSKTNPSIVNSRGKFDEWAKTLSDSETYKEMDRNDLTGFPRFSEAPRKETATNKEYVWKESRTNNWPDFNERNPKEERRYYSGEPVYNSPNTGWPRFSVESLKHGNLAGNVKTWPDVPIDQSLDSSKDAYNFDKSSDNWPNFPAERNPDTYIWPNYSEDDTNHNSIITGKVSAWSKPSSDSAESKQREIMTNTWAQMPTSHQKTISAIDTAIAHHTKESSSNKQWPHFAYHRVTSSPQIIAQQQKEAQQRARHRNAYIAVSVIAPPGKSKGFNKSQSRNSTNTQVTKSKANESPAKPSAAPLPDKMDQLLSMRSEQKIPDKDMLEEQLVDMAVEGQQGALPWSHARHLDKIQEQLKTLSAMGEKLRYHWLEKERLLQILRDGGKSGSGFFRSQRDGSKGQQTVSPANNSSMTTTTTSSTMTTNSPDILTTPYTTNNPPPAA